MSYFFGQQLSNRTGQQGSPDPLSLRVWLALRYVALVASAVLAGALLDRSPGGALLLGVGLAALVTGILNLLMLPKDERNAIVDLLLLVGGAIFAVAGSLIVRS